MGPPAIGLLLLRLTIGLTLVVRGVTCLGESTDAPSVWAAAVSVSRILSGGFLCAGLLTPVAATGAGIVAILTNFQVLADCNAGRFDSRIGSIFALAMLLALTLLGPGAYSIDARLYGRREIIIPRARSRES